MSVHYGYLAASGTRRGDSSGDVEYPLLQQKTAIIARKIASSVRYWFYQKPRRGGDLRKTRILGSGGTPKVASQNTTGWAGLGHGIDGSAKGQLRKGRQVIFGRNKTCGRGPGEVHPITAISHACRSISAMVY